MTSESTTDESIYESMNAISIKSTTCPETFTCLIKLPDFIISKIYKYLDQNDLLNLIKAVDFDGQKKTNPKPKPKPKTDNQAKDHKQRSKSKIDKFLQANAIDVWKRDWKFTRLDIKNYVRDKDGMRIPQMLYTANLLLKYLPKRTIESIKIYLYFHKVVFYSSGIKYFHDYFQILGSKKYANKYKDALKFLRKENVTSLGLIKDDDPGDDESDSDDEDDFDGGHDDECFIETALDLISKKKSKKSFPSLETLEVVGCDIIPSIGSYISKLPTLKKLRIEIIETEDQFQEINKFDITPFFKHFLKPNNKQQFESLEIDFGYICYSVNEFTTYNPLDPFGYDEEDDANFDRSECQAYLDKFLATKLSPNCRVLKLEYGLDITDDVLINIFKKYGNSLECLHIGHNTSLTNKPFKFFIDNFKKVPLKKLNVGDSEYIHADTGNDAWLTEKSLKDVFVNLERSSLDKIIVKGK